MIGPIGVGSTDITDRDGAVEAVIDAELGILVRCQGSGRGGRKGKPSVVEFTWLHVPGDGDEGLFEPPPGSFSIIAHEARRTPTAHLGLPQEALERAKTVVGVAAGGLGAAARYSPRRLIRGHQGEVSEPIPDDEPPPGSQADPASGPGEAPVSGEVLSLLYRSGSARPRFTAAIEHRVNVTGLLAGMPGSWRKAGLGGVGYLADSLGAGRDGPRTTRSVSIVAIDGWHRYRIENQAPAGRRMADQVLARGCDGERYWKLHKDRVSVGDSRQAPAELADLVDTSWLLGCDLGGGEPVTVGGRLAYRLTVRGRWLNSDLLMFGYPAVAILDAQSGRLLRLTSYANGQPVSRDELRDVVPAGDPPGGSEGDEYGVPPGLRVVDINSLDDLPPGSRAAVQAAGTVRRQTGKTITAARGFLDSLRGQR
jgi:hypothetical protein